MQSAVGGAFALSVAASAQDLGDLFEYKLKAPITIQKNRSALVPIVQAGIAAEKISIWNDRAGLPRPARAPYGSPIRVASRWTAAASASLKTARSPANECSNPSGRIKSASSLNAIDLALKASSKNAIEAQRVRRVRAAGGVMIHASDSASAKRTAGTCGDRGNPTEGRYWVRND